MSKTVKPSWRFPALESDKPDSSTAATMGSPFYFFDLTGSAFKMGLPDIVAEDGSSLVRRVSCINAAMGSPLYLFIINLLVMNVSCGNFFLGFGNDDLLLFGVKQDIKYQLRKMNRYG